MKRGSRPHDAPRVRVAGDRAPPGQGRAVVDAADGFRRLDSDAADRLRHQIQLLGQFLIDRDGVIRWCRTEDCSTYAQFPSIEELLSLAKYCFGGCLMSYWADEGELYRRAATYVDRIPKGRAGAPS